MADLRLRGLCKSFGNTPILHGIDLDIADGEFTVFVGPSGCGKSTLLRCIAGLEDITGGDIHVGGEWVNDVPPAQRGMAMVFQSYALYPHMSVAQNMAFGLKLAGQSKAQIQAAVQRAAQTLQIEHLLDRKPRALSGGQRQRVAIGRAIVRTPGIFLFDEPLSNLDAALRTQMRVELAQLHRQLKTTMVYVTHDQVEAMTLAHRLVVLNAGRIEQVGAPMDVYHHPVNLFVAGFIGSPKMNFLPAVLVSTAADHAVVQLSDGARLTVQVDASAAAAGDKVTLGFRPEHADASVQPQGQGCAGEVRAAEHLGDATFLYVAVAGAETHLVIRADADNPLEVCATAHVSIPAHRCHLFDATGHAFARTAR